MPKAKTFLLGSYDTPADQLFRGSESLPSSSTKHSAKLSFWSACPVPNSFTKKESSCSDPTGTCYPVFQRRSLPADRWLASNQSRGPPGKLENQSPLLNAFGTGGREESLSCSLPLLRLGIPGKEDANKKNHTLIWHSPLHCFLLSLANSLLGSAFFRPGSVPAFFIYSLQVLNKFFSA